MNKLKKIAIFLLLFSIIFEIAVRVSNVFYWLPLIDKPMHFSWGATVFMILITFLKFTPLNAFLGVIIKQFLWETAEIIGDKIILQPDYMQDILWPDGIFDTLFDLAGASLIYFLLLNKKEFLFVYGTLKDPKVQLKIIGRILPLKKDAIIGFKKSAIAIEGNKYLCISKDPKSKRKMTGYLLEITNSELAKIDDYETDNYKRIEATLESGKEAWVYIKN